MTIDIEDNTTEEVKQIEMCDLECGTVFQGSIYDVETGENIFGKWLFASTGSSNDVNDVDDVEDGFFRLDDGNDYEPFSGFFFKVTDPNEFITDFKELKATLVLENA
jgi:hypothetical protein